MVGLQLHGRRIYGRTEGIIPKQKSSTPFLESLSSCIQNHGKMQFEFEFYFHVSSSSSSSSSRLFLNLFCQSQFRSAVDGQLNPRCIASNGVLGFDCECNPGWKKIRIGALTFPSCIVPNYMFNVDCLSVVSCHSACALKFPSREGTLDLQCGKGVSSPPPNPTPASLLPPSFNLLDRNFGAGCTGLGFGQHSPPSPSLSGSIRVSNCWSCLQALTMVALAAVFLVWV
ncbi:hypothetical protein CK203_094780 [Vitis vinifera]|uniref:EGF-like domain-containing protein n=1 Tax=Vitis vinifera TaxID=29760 RepID=A0A438D0I4_VITVI|nr:hypothetical protein CK203_094780 [Vitis vinifera]